MKRFITRGLCFALIGFLLLFGLNFFYVRTNGYKSLDGTYKFNKVPDGINVMNLGSSHGEFGLDYEEFSTITAFNLGLRSQSHFFDFQILKKYGDKLAPGCVVIIPVSCYSLLHGVDREQRILYYKVLGYGSIPNHDPMEYVEFRLLPVLTASFNLKYLVRDKKGMDPDLFASPGPDEEFYNINGLYYYGLFDDLKKQGATNENNVKTLGEIIEYCQDNGFKPVLITTPFTNAYNYWYSTEDYSEFYAAIDRITEKYDVPYLDYSHDLRFTGNLDMFADSDHLTLSGRQVFTRILLTDIGAIPGG